MAFVDKMSFRYSKQFPSFEIGGEESDAYFPLLYLPRSSMRLSGEREQLLRSFAHTWNDKRGEKIFIAVIYDLATRSRADSFATRRVNSSTRLVALETSPETTLVTFPICSFSERFRGYLALPETSEAAYHHATLRRVKMLDFVCNRNGLERPLETRNSRGVTAHFLINLGLRSVNLPPQSVPR